jgi:hypothetical protein
MTKMPRVAICGDDLQGDVGIVRHSDRFCHRLSAAAGLRGLSCQTREPVVLYGGVRL